MKDQHAYQRAEKRVKARLGFFFHLTVYIAVNTFLCIQNISSPTAYFWAKWPLMGWGIGLFFHGLSVFMLCGKSELVRRMVEKEMQKEV